MSNENQDIIISIKKRIEELNVEITEHERDNNERSYSFYAKGSELYQELITLNTILSTNGRFVKGS